MRANAAQSIGMVSIPLTDHTDDFRKQYSSAFPLTLSMKAEGKLTGLLVMCLGTALNELPSSLYA